MKKEFLKVLCLLTGGIIVSTLIAGCQTGTNPTSGSSEQETQNGGSDPTPLTILSPEDGRVVKEDNPVWLEIEKQTNTDLSLMLLPGSDIPNKLNTMAASKTLPDIVKHRDFFPYAQQNLLLDIGDLIEEHGPNLKKHLPEHIWEYTKFNGQTVAIPYYNDAGKYVTAIRQDWLDNLNLDQPETLDDYYDIAIRFANEDPDGNGEKDSYAFSAWVDFMPVYGAHGLIEGRAYYITDEQAYPTIISPEYKDVLAFMNRLWEENAIDPDFLVMQTEQRRQKFAQGTNGMLTDWWSIVPEILIGQLGFEELNPDGEWVILPDAPQGPGGPFGNGGLRSQGDYQNATWISVNSDHPTEAIKLLDFFVSDEGYELTYFGLKNVHYETLTGGRSEEGRAAFEEKWLDSFNQIVGRRLDIIDTIRLGDTDPQIVLQNEYIDAGLSYNLFLDAFYGLPVTDAEGMYSVDLDSFETESRIAFVTGERPLTEYDEYVQEWLDLGGKNILESKVELYNELRGVNIKSGIQ